MKKERYIQSVDVTHINKKDLLHTPDSDTNWSTNCHLRGSSGELWVQKSAVTVALHITHKSKNYQQCLLHHLFAGIIPTSVQIKRKHLMNYWEAIFINNNAVRNLSSGLTYGGLWVTQSFWSWWDWWPPRGYRRRWSIRWCAQSHHQPIDHHRIRWNRHIHNQCQAWSLHLYSIKKKWKKWTWEDRQEKES